MSAEDPVQLAHLWSPWRLTVTCVLCNLTPGERARPVLRELFRRWPSPSRMAAAGPELEGVLRPLGLWRRRAWTLRRMSAQWAAWFGGQRRRPSIDEVARLHGVGRYALDSYAIFALRRRDVRPRDRVLRAHLEMLRAEDV